MVGQLGVVHLQRPAYGVALLVRKVGLRSAARAALPNPRQGPVSMWEDEQQRTPDG
jgi:hypothetical protein